MSLVFPNYLPGVLFTARKSPTFKTGIHTALTGKESRIAYRAFPLYEWELDYELLRDYADGKANLAPYSTDLTQWIASNGSSATDYSPVVVADQVLAPDGTLTADQLILNKGAGSTVNDLSQLSIATVATLPPGSVTVSFWARSLDGTSPVIQVAYAGVAGTVTVTPVWSRVAITLTAITLVNPTIALALQGGSGSSNFANIAVWGVQAESGTSVGAYIPTNGATVAAGDLKSLFGFFNSMLGQQGTFLYQDPDFNTVSQCPFALGNNSTTTFPLTVTYSPGNTYPGPYGLGSLPELCQNPNGPPDLYTWRFGAPELLGSAGRTNLLLQDRFAASWTALNDTLTAAAATSPDGTSNAASLNDGIAAGSHCISQNVTITGGSYNTFSVWLKYSSRQYAQLVLDNNGGGNSLCVALDLQNGVITNTNAQGVAALVGATMTSFGSGWYRVTLSGVLANADTTARCAIAQTNTPNASTILPSYTGTSALTLAWGAQLEAGTLPTALIHTTTGSASITDYSLTATGSVVFGVAPANNVQITWSGSFYYRVRFSEDSLDFDEMMSKFWELKKLSFQQVKL